MLRAQGNASLRSFLGTINVIFAALEKTGSHPSKVMSVAQPLVENSNVESKGVRVKIQPALSFFRQG